MGNEMNGVLGHDSALYGYTGSGTTWLMGRILLCIIPLVQDQLLDLLTSSPCITIQLNYGLLPPHPQRMEEMGRDADTEKEL